MSVKTSDNLIFLLHDCKMKCPYNFPRDIYKERMIYDEAHFNLAKYIIIMMIKMYTLTFFQGVS